MDIDLLEKLEPDVRERYEKKELTIKDLLEQKNVFLNINVSSYMDKKMEDLVNFFSNNYGDFKFQELVYKYPDFFLYLERISDFKTFSTYLRKTGDINYCFKKAVKMYYFVDKARNSFSSHIYEIDNEEQYEPLWLSKMGFEIKKGIESIDDLLNYNDDTFLLNSDQMLFIESLGIENIKKLDSETNIFQESEKGIHTFHRLYFYFFNYANKANFNSGELNYDEFLDRFAKFLNDARLNSLKNIYGEMNYDYIKGNFREKYPKIFISSSAPDDLKEMFYEGEINIQYIENHKGYAHYFSNMDLDAELKLNTKIYEKKIGKERSFRLTVSDDFAKEYVSRYQNKEFLKLIYKYGEFLEEIEIIGSEKMLDDKNEFDKSIRRAIYEHIVKENDNYYSLSKVDEFVKEYPKLFVEAEELEKTGMNKEEIEQFYRYAYSRKLNFGYIQKYPYLVNVLKNKELDVMFRDDLSYALKFISNENFLELCSRYGNYLDSNMLNSAVIFSNRIDKDEYIKNSILNDIESGEISYHPSDAPKFLIEEHPELFLSDDAPEELKYLFYNSDVFSFSPIVETGCDLNFLKGKNITPALLRNYLLKTGALDFEKLFGRDNMLALGISKPETVDEMLFQRKTECMKKWWDKTGGKFIPDHVVMQNFDVDEIDKFLTSGSKWSKLMQNESFAKTTEPREAMLKLAYSFGVFDNDQRGFKKLQELLTEIPTKISSSEYGILSTVSLDLLCYANNYDKNEKIDDKDYLAKNAYNLIKALREENASIDFSKPIFEQLYKKTGEELKDIKEEQTRDDKNIVTEYSRLIKNLNSTYTLTINEQSNPKTIKAIRKILDENDNFNIITPSKAHQLFGGFKMEYNPDFREFLLSNMNEILDKPEYASYISNIQKQFNQIKSINSNRKLTLDLAVSYVKNNRYDFVDVGNEKVAHISSAAGYSNKDFEVLQQIYNYGKQRTFSSIPRVNSEKTLASGKYNYEMLKLDDPLAMVIGTLTDCCQELGDNAEMCMEHSMVSKNGRVFVIKDENQNVVAQSWVWRNKDVLCFDNIEIPEKAFKRASKNNISREDFANDVYDIYKEAAQSLIKEDEIKYSNLLRENKISKEQYDGLRLGKVTVGLGWNDIASAINKNSYLDEDVARPLPFEAPVKLSRSLYTSDSVTQHILEKRNDRIKYNGDTLAVYNDSYTIYDDSNFKSDNLMSLKKLEGVSKNYYEKAISSIYEEDGRTNYVSEISSYYDLEPDKTKIIMNPNFAIIYEIDNDELKIGDLLFNTSASNGTNTIDITDSVLMQINLAINQIKGNRKIDASSLNEEQQKMYYKATSLTDEIDIEREIKHAK